MRALDEMPGRRGAPPVHPGALTGIVLRRVLALAVVAVPVAWLLDRWLARDGDPDGRPAPLEMLAVVDAPIDTTWAVVADIPRQVEWMREMKSVSVDTPGPVARRDEGRGDRPDPRHPGHRPRRDHRARAAPAVRDPAPRAVRRRRPDHARGRAPTARRRSSAGRSGSRRRCCPALGAARAGTDPALDLPGRPPPPQAPGRDRRGGRLRPATTTEEPTTTMQVHLVDATYELFRAHFAPRPPVLGRDGKPLSGVSGLVEQLLFLLREQGATHVGCATDRVIRSFRNDLYAGLQDRGRDAARAARPVPDRRAGDRGPGARAVVDGRVRGRRRDRRRGRAGSPPTRASSGS